MYRLKIFESIIARIECPRKFIQVLVGPRQVGKTTVIGQVLEAYGEKFSYRLAEGLGMRPIEWLESEWNAARVLARAQGGYLLVFDEIQKIEGWSDVVKRLWDEDSFARVPLKIVLLGSSRLLLQAGLNESLAGRFELLDVWHWSFADMQKAFGYTLEEYVLLGGYPGAAEFRNDEARWRNYVRDSIVEPSISRDILQLEKVAKPALLRQTFVLGCTYSAKILSYQKMLGQLQDAGNTTTLAHYLQLLGEAGLVCGLPKYYEEPVRTRASSPKLAVCNTALATALSPYSLNEIRSDSARWGHAVESAVGVHLLATARTEGIEVLYWNVGIKEVDYVLRKGERLAAIEVKSAQADSVSGMKEFRAKNPEAKIYLIGGQGMPLETFFTLGAPDFL